MVRIKEINAVKRLAHAWMSPFQWETLTQLAGHSWTWGCILALPWRKSNEWSFGRLLGKVFILGQEDPWLLGFPTWVMSQFPANSYVRAGRASNPSATAPWNAGQTQVATDGSFSGHSPSLAAQSAMKGLISYAVQNVIKVRSAPSCERWELPTPSAEGKS